ncbi:MAG: methionine gamma-lyase family protein, partial [Clostridia bacterium]|nr:methionine gamma-lyase family protein [Clostridia bacterium]
MEISEKVYALVVDAERELADIFAELDRVSFKNTAKIMELFKEYRVSEAMFNPTSGYGYDDRGRDTLDEIWAEVMGAESAFVRHNIVNGTQALTIGLFGLLRPGDIMLSIAGKPYDTLEEVIGICGTPGDGSLKDFGVQYDQVDLKDGAFDYDLIKEKLAEFGERVKVVFIQR